MTRPVRKILAIGDCNVKGLAGSGFAPYVARVAAALGGAVDNRGVTMATTREGLRILRDHLGDEHDVVFIQFGLVDSWVTVSHAPYVMYYPDGFWRKLGRKLAKKYKKIARRLGLERVLGRQNVVPETEYRRNLEAMLGLAGKRPVVLIETVANRDLKRNPEITRYNGIMRELAAASPSVVCVETYEVVAGDMAGFLMEDGTHLTDAGHQAVADRVLSSCRALPGRRDG